MNSSTPKPGPPWPDLDLAALIQRAFRPRSEDRRLALMVDLPDDQKPDHPGWQWRRGLAHHWWQQLRGLQPSTELQCSLLLYRNARRNNGDFPDIAWQHLQGPLPAHADELSVTASSAMQQLLSEQHLILAPTELSATAPLKLHAKEHGFRAATMPGLAPEMLPALALDMGEIDRRVRHLQALLSRAHSARFLFDVNGTRHELVLDLRHRQAHASSGLITEPGSAGNLPSGETYIVPYEGEREGDPSRTEGILPVQLDGEVVLYRIRQNRAYEVLSTGPRSSAEAQALLDEPAYGNMSELGLGVLADFGLQPIGQILLDEKLGLHIAFGRSDHFGGQTGSDDFSDPQAVVHIDRVYLPELQPQVHVRAVDLQLEEDRSFSLMRDGGYVPDLFVDAI